MIDDNPRHQPEWSGKPMAKDNAQTIDGDWNPEQIAPSFRDLNAIEIDCRLRELGFLGLMGLLLPSWLTLPFKRDTDD
jgi:hypothetical protein